MKTRQLPRSIRVAIAIGALGALVAAAPARALDQDAWLQQQLSISDGGSYTPFVPSEKSASAYKSDDAQSAWLQEQLAISDGTAYTTFVPRPGTGKAYKMDAQSVWVQRQLAISDGSAPIDRGDAGPVYADAPRTAAVSAK